MKKFIALLFFAILAVTTSNGQLSFVDGTSNYLIDFDATVSGVNSGSFTGSGFANSPSSGQLDADAWATTGLSDGSKGFGTSNTSGDHARGSNDGGVSTGGIYGFDIGGGNRAIGIQPTGSDWTPGTLSLRMVNNSSTVITEMDIAYTIYVRNDQNRASSFNFSISYNNTNYSDITSANYTSPQSSGSTAWEANPRSIQLTGLQIDPGGSYYIRWSGSDAGGSGSRDELALDDISIVATGSTTNCVEPTAQASGLNFGTISSNSIQASFTGGTADKYLVVQSTNSSLGASPADGVTYSAGNILGNGEVLQYSNSTSINSLGLIENTTYYYFIFASNDICSGGPDYLSTNPLTGSATTEQNGNSNYYANIGNETCENLKTALHNLIKDHTSVSYNSLWTHYQTTDDHLNDSGNEVIVWDMYSDNPNGSENEFTFVSEQCGTYQSEGDCYNREHTFPKSWWGGSTSPPQYTDIFTVIPADGWINGVRNNNPYGEVQSGTETQITNNGCRLGSSSISIPGYSSSVFEPTDDYKGDLARGYFYMATRYENVIAGWENFTSESDAVLDGTSYQVFEPWMLDMLTNWHNNDPVDQKEIDRNEAIFAIQGNRNPFIDHPEYVASIWGGCTGDTEAPSTPSSLIAFNTLETSTDLSWNGATDNIAVAGYKIYQDGVNVLSIGTNTNTTVTGLNSGTTYTFYVTAYDAAGNESNNSNTASVTTPSVDNISPTAPTALLASNTSENSTDLSWNASSDNVGVVGYNIYQDGSYIFNSTSTEVTVTGLNEGTTYTYYVTAYDAAGNESNISNTIDITTNSSSSEVVFHEGYFESGWDGWQDGGSDCARYSGIYSSEGNYSIRIRDNSGTKSAMTSPTFDISNYSSIDIDFSFYPSSMETNEDFWVRFYDGSSWQTIATFTRGVDFNNNVFYTANVSITNSEYNFPTNAQFRFQCDASANNDRIYIDAVILTANASNNALIASNSIEEVTMDNPNDYDENIIIPVEEKEKVSSDYNLSSNTVYPNPTNNYINIDLRSENDQIISIGIFDVMGRESIKITPSEITSLIQKDVSHLENGLYFVRIINHKKEIQTLKFYVIK